MTFDLTNLGTIKQLLQKHNLWAKKAMGQNFLVSDASLQKIVMAADITPDDFIIEVGPGLGVLTQELAKKAAKVKSIELDASLFPLLDETLKSYANIEIVNENALDFIPPETPYKIVANIPYYITSPLINHFLQNAHKPQTITLLVQKEVAEKICQLTPDMSVLSLQVALFGHATLMGIVPRHHFHPAPKVDSAILHIAVKQPSDPDYLSTESALEVLKLAKRAFLSGRKKLSNTLSDLKEKLTELNLADERPQHLSIEDWQKLLS